MPYTPIPAEPFPPSEGWFIVWWNEDYDCWSAATTVIHDRAEAVRRLEERRSKTDLPLRLVRENSSYTAEDA